ncbi:MAG: hypothetical protein EPO57_01505 [Chitinophagaceae bacterium]|nr:MAG: hypothetical protein EPO57_01505 [Chitinophagaceae bacterium]
MKKIFTLLAFSTISTLLFSQTADDIINSYIKSMGGLEKLNSIQTLHTIGIATAPNGTEVKTEVWKEHNKLFRRETNFGMGSMIMLVTDEGAWSTSPRSGGSFEAMPEERRKTQLSEMDCQGPLVNYAAKGIKAEYLGKETIDGKECFKIKLTMQDGREQNYFLDASTYYINRVSYKPVAGGGGGGGGRTGGGGGMQRDPNAEVVFNYSNYEKTTDGFVFAFTTSMAGGFGGNVTFELIEVNSKIDSNKYKPE